MAQRTVKDDYQALRDDLQQLRGDLSALANSVVTSGKTRASETKQSAVANARERLERLASQAGEVRNRGLEAVENVEREVAGHPWRSVLTVFGVGVFVGMVLKWILGRGGE